MPHSKETLQLIARRSNWDDSPNTSHLRIGSLTDPDIESKEGKVIGFLQANGINPLKGAAGISDGKFRTSTIAANPEEPTRLFSVLVLTNSDADKIRAAARTELIGEVRTPAASGEREIDNSKPLAGITILYIEDEKPVRDVYETGLKRFTAANVIAVAGHAEIERVLKLKGNPEIGLVISDRNIAGQTETGDEWINSVIRGQKNLEGINRDTPMVLLTANAPRGGLDPKAEVALKPIFVPQLMGHIRKAFQKQGKEFAIPAAPKKANSEPHKSWESREMLERIKGDEPSRDLH